MRKTYFILILLMGFLSLSAQVICHEPEFYEGLATRVLDCSDWSLRV